MRLGADENEYVKHLGYRDREVELELGMIEAIRKATAAVWKKLLAVAFARTRVNSVEGLQTLERILTAAANHIAHHLTFVAEKKKALGP